MSQAIRLDRSVVLAAGEDGYLAYQLRGDRLYRLNPTAALIVELCDGTRDLAHLQTDLEPVVGHDWPRWRAWIARSIEDGLLTDEPPNDSTDATPDAAALARRADSLRVRDRVLAAYVCQHRATELAPDDPDLWYGLGELAHIVGRREEARVAYQRYLAARPDDAEIAHIVTALTDSAPPDRVPDRCIEQLYSRFASFYDDNMVGELDYCAPDRLRDAAVAALGDGGDLDVLDLGCGTGLSGARWRARASRLVGIDLSPHMIDRARERGIYDSLEVGEITTWLARDQAGLFDLVTACDTFIYFGDLAAVVTLAAARLKPGGVLAFTVERGATEPFRLSDSGRFTHHPRHLSTVITAAGLTLVSLGEAIVRHEYGEPVTALVAVGRR